MCMLEQLACSESWRSFCMPSNSFAPHRLMGERAALLRHCFFNLLRHQIDIYRRIWEASLLAIGLIRARYWTDQSEKVVLHRGRMHTAHCDKYQQHVEDRIMHTIHTVIRPAGPTEGATHEGSDIDD